MCRDCVFGLRFGIPSEFDDQIAYEAFEEGAKWQSEQPIVVTDEMVERGVMGAHRVVMPDMMLLFRDVFGSQERYEEFLYAVTCGVLEAALQATGVDNEESSEES